MNLDIKAIGHIERQEPHESSREVLLLLFLKDESIFV